METRYFRLNGERCTEAQAHQEHGEQVWSLRSSGTVGWVVSWDGQEQLGTQRGGLLYHHALIQLLQWQADDHRRLFGVDWEVVYDAFRRIRNGCIELQADTGAQEYVHAAEFAGEMMRWAREMKEGDMS